MAAAVEEYIDRLKSIRGVIGVVVHAADGAVVASTLAPADAASHAAAATQLMQRADALPDAPTQLAVRTKKHEIVYSASDDRRFGLVVLHNPDAPEVPRFNMRDVISKLEALGVTVPPNADRRWVMELLEAEMLRRGS